MRKSGLTGDEAYVLSKRRGTSGDLGPLKKELSLLKEDLGNLSSSKISKFYATNNGENHLADSDDGKIADMMVYGKSEQKKYHGEEFTEIIRSQCTRKCKWSFGHNECGWKHICDGCFNIYLVKYYKNK